MKVVVASSEAVARSASGTDNPSGDHFKPNIINLVAKFDVTDDEKAGKALIARVYISALLSNIERSVEDGYAVLPIDPNDDSSESIEITTSIPTDSTITKWFNISDETITRPADSNPSFLYFYFLFFTFFFF
jgi:hypothetical protein